MRTIHAGPISLEPQTAAHAAEMFVVLSDPAIYAHENEPPSSLESLRVRFTRLESRLSGDGREQWLNWVIRLPDAELIGYVQATVFPNHRALIAYEMKSSHWGRGLGYAATRAMISELREQYQVTRVCAVLKQSNLRSRRLLDRLGFALASPETCLAAQIEADEILMVNDVAA